MKVLFVYPHFQRHAEANPQLLDFVPMNEYLGSPSLGIAHMISLTPKRWEVDYIDDRLQDATEYQTDADIVALSFFTAAASRAMKIADHFRAQGKTVVAGGIFPTMMPDVVQEHVDVVVVGEGEPSWPLVLRDFEAGTLKPRYSLSCSLDLSTVPVPDLSYYFAEETPGRFQPDDYPVQLTRGCSLNCHACALPKVMTRNQRAFPLDQIKGQLDQLGKMGKMACLTEDTSWFPGPKGRGLLEKVLDLLIESDEPARISYIGISMPMIIITPRRVFQKAKEAGVDMFYLVGGFDPITMKAFTGKHPKAYQRGLDAIAKAYDVGIEPYTSFLLGGDQDDEGTVDRMLQFAEDSKLMKAEFAIATPYPGTPQWDQLVKEDRILHRDWSKYNDANIVFQPKQMTPDQVTEGYLRLWREFYATRQSHADLCHRERTIQF